MTRFYAETETPTGRWMSCSFTYRPETKSVDGALRLKRTDGVGPRLRFAPVEVPKDHAHLNLDQLREVYSPDGLLQATARNPQPEIEADGFITVETPA